MVHDSHRIKPEDNLPTNYSSRIDDTPNTKSNSSQLYHRLNHSKNSGLNEVITIPASRRRPSHLNTFSPIVRSRHNPSSKLVKTTVPVASVALAVSKLKRNQSENQEMYNNRIKRLTLKRTNTQINLLSPRNKIFLKIFKLPNLKINSSMSFMEKSTIYYNYIIETRMYTMITTILTIYCLFGDDIRLSLFHLQQDIYFYDLSFIAFIIFSLEFLGACLLKPGYSFSTLSPFASFYFWLDLSGTLSLIPDIGWLWSLIVSGNNTTSGLAALKTGRASRAGTKAGRVIRFVRLIRMIRIVKLYKISKGEDTNEMELQIANEPSKVGKKMSEMSTRVVIMIVIGMVVLLPLFDGFKDSINQYQLRGLEKLHHWACQENITKDLNNTNSFSILYKDFFDSYIRESGKLIYINITNISQSITNGWLQNIRFQLNEEYWRNYTEIKSSLSLWSYDMIELNEINVYNKYRTTDINRVTINGCFDKNEIAYPNSKDICISTAIFDESNTIRTTAGMSILKTFFVMIILASGSIAFSRISEGLVIGPIERMMDLVTRLAKNPLCNTQIKNHTNQDKIAKQQGYETALLETTLMKIGALMQVGFGAAGADIIGKNMSQSTDGTNGELDPMLPGKKITAIYGFCDIRQFTDTTECLQEEVMVYVNKLGDIMHSGTHAYYGMANKNVGDAFLLSWKLCDGELPGFSKFTDHPNENTRKNVNKSYKCPPSNGFGKIYRTDITPTELAESALTAFIKCMIDLENNNTNGTLTEYLTKPNVIKRFGSNFRIKMGFGMHIGWAIEGAIGSKYKIDATYISPHVQMADRLEAGSKIFNIPLNLSHYFVALLSPDARKYLRKLDRIKVHGCDIPMTIYTYDVINMIKGFGEPVIDPSTNTQLPVNFNNNIYKALQEGLHPGFLDIYNKGIQSYIDGNWDKAKEYLEIALEYKNNDGPSKNLIQVMKEYQFKCPENWPGYRHVDNY